MSDQDTATNDTIPVLETSIVTLFPFEFLQEGDQCFVQCPDPEEVLVLPAVGLDIMQLLQQGLPVGEVSQRLPDDDPEGYDIPDFVQALISYGFVEAVDGTPVAP